MRTIANEIHKAEHMHQLAEQEHMKAVESLIKSVDKLNVVFEAMNEGVLVSSNTGTITNANSRLVQMLGYNSLDNLTGKLAVDLISPDERDKITDLIRKSLILHDRVIVGSRMLKTDGSAFSVELSISPLMDKSNGSNGIVVIVRDITEDDKSESTIRTLNQTLKIRTADLESANRYLKAFSSSIANELKSPLRRVEGFSKAIMEDYAGKLDEQGNYYLHSIEAETHLMAQLIDDMLKLYSVTICDIHFDMVDLSFLTQDIFDKLKNIYNKHQVNLTIQSELKVYSDRQLLQTVLEELLDNAFKFTESNPHAEIQFGKTSYNGREAYFVKDNGVGFDTHFASKLFKPFQRLHSELEFKGNGIGLSIVQSIIYRLGGEVWAEAEKGKGAAFYFTLNERGYQS